MKIYVQVVEKFFKKERKDETHLITKKLMVFLVSGHPRP
jgi:hypothetical protein